MKVLGIDTILHDVCVAVTENHKVLSNESISTPMSNAAQGLLCLTVSHVKEIGKILNKALSKARISLNDISLIAVNNSGSLLSNVLIGAITGNVLSQINDIPIVSVSHQEGHIFSNWIERDRFDFDFPILVFSASGGHNLIALITRDDFKFHIISETKGIKKKSRFIPEFVGLGFLFSQVVIALGLQGSKERKKGDGKFIAQLAKKGNPQRFIFVSKIKKNNMEPDFKFLLKSVCKLIRREKRKKRMLANEFICDIAASFENALADGLSNFLYFLANKHHVKEIHLVGGLSANETIRNKLFEKAKTKGIMSRYPVKLSYCTDNAAMIATAGYYKFMQNPQKYNKQRCLDIKSDLILERLAINQHLKYNKSLK